MRGLLACGVISYTVYLSHWPVLIVMERIWGKALGSNPPLKLAGIAMATLAAWALTVLVERPAMRLAARLLAAGRLADGRLRKADLAVSPGSVKGRQ